MTPPLQQKWRVTEEPLNESERGEWKSWLKTQDLKIMTSSPITSRQIDGETIETVRDFIFLSSKIIADGDAALKLKDACSLDEKLWPP